MKVTVNKPNIAPGTPVEVQGLGVFENGTTTELEREGDDLLVGEPLEKAQTKAPELPQTPGPLTPDKKEDA